MLRHQRRGGVLVLVLDHPPANALTAELIASLSKALEAAAGDPGVTAVMLIGAGRGFSAGMDPRLFGTVAGASALSALALRIESFAKPVTAVLHGSCLGAGLELALACHWRLAAPTAQFGMPEVHLGLPPGSGGSQRLPRLIGGGAALRLLLEGVPLAAAEGLALGLVDQLASGDVFQAGLEFAASRPGPRPTSGRNGPVELYGPKGALAAARARVAGQPLPAPQRIVELVEASGLLPFAQGLVVEATAFADLAAGEAAQGLRAAWEAERRALQVPAAVAAVTVPKMEVLGLWQPGEAGIAVLLRALQAGMSVILSAPEREGLVAALNQVAARHDQAVAAGALTEAARDAEWARLSASPGPGALAGADAILADSAEGLPAGLCLSVGGLAAGQDGPALVLHEGFAEVALGPASVPSRAARAVALARRLGLRCLFAGPGGPILTRLNRALTEAMLVQEAAGTAPEAIEAALVAFRTGAARAPGEAEILRACLAALAAEGARLIEDGTARRPAEVDAAAILAGLVPRWEGGPMAWADRLGLLVLRADLWSRAAAEPSLYAAPPLFDRLIADGRALASLNARR